MSLTGMSDPPWRQPRRRGSEGSGGGGGWRSFFRRLFHWRGSRSQGKREAAKAKGAKHFIGRNLPDPSRPQLAPQASRAQAPLAEQPRRRALPFCTENMHLPVGGRDAGVWGPPPLPPHPRRLPAQLHVLLGTLPRRPEYTLCAPGGVLYPPPPGRTPPPATPPPPPAGSRARPRDDLDERFAWLYDLPPASALRGPGWPRREERREIPPYEPYKPYEPYWLSNLPPELDDEDSDFSPLHSSLLTPQPQPTPSPSPSPLPSLKPSSSSSLSPSTPRRAASIATL